MQFLLGNRLGLHEGPPSVVGLRTVTYPVSRSNEVPSRKSTKQFQYFLYKLSTLMQWRNELYSSRYRPTPSHISQAVVRRYARRDIKAPRHVTLYIYIFRTKDMVSPFVPFSPSFHSYC